MKYPLALGSILLLMPAIAQAQARIPLEDAPTLILPTSPRSTPTLDAFAGVATKIELQARWVRIDAANLPKNLPAWDKAGNSSHVATPEELKTLELMDRTGTATISNQAISALNNQAAELSYSPFTSFKFLQSPPDAGTLDDMNILSKKSMLSILEGATRPYMPNLARPDSRLSEMAPMPGAGGKSDPPFIRPTPPTRPQMSPQMDEMLAYKFQLRPIIIGQQIALNLSSLNSANDIDSLARADFGETVVFALPNIVEFLQSSGAQGPQYQTKRTFLLVTPSLTPPQTLGLPKIPKP